VFSPQLAGVVESFERPRSGLRPYIARRPNSRHASMAFGLSYAGFGEFAPASGNCRASRKARPYTMRKLEVGGVGGHRLLEQRRRLGGLTGKYVCHPQGHGISCGRLAGVCGFENARPRCIVYHRAATGRGRLRRGIVGEIAIDGGRLGGLMRFFECAGQLQHPAPVLGSSEAAWR